MSAYTTATANANVMMTRLVRRVAMLLRLWRQRVAELGLLRRAVREGLLRVHRIERTPLLLLLELLLCLEVLRRVGPLLLLRLLEIATTATASVLSNAGSTSATLLGAAVLTRHALLLWIVASAATRLLLPLLRRLLLLLLLMQLLLLLLWWQRRRKAGAVGQVAAVDRERLLLHREREMRLLREGERSAAIGCVCIELLWLLVGGRRIGAGGEERRIGAAVAAIAAALCCNERRG